MNIVMKSTLKGFLRGLIASIAVYAVFFLVELFTYFGKANEMNKIGGPGLTLAEYFSGEVVYNNSRIAPVMPVWKPLIIAIIVAVIFALAIVISFIIGLYNKKNHRDNVATSHAIEFEEGSVRQKQRYAQNIKTMAESITEKCDENLHYMKNIVEVEYAGEQAINDIMTELTKFIEYERVIKDGIEESGKGGEG